MTGLKLGYLAFGVRDLEAWQQFATEVLGLEARREGDELRLRMDDYAQRFFIAPGNDDLEAIGWEADSDAVLDDKIEALRAAGRAVTTASPEQARARGVARLEKLEDPAGIPLELFVGPARATTRFESERVRSGFVTGEQGMGHLVISANAQAESQAFYTELLGFKLSDYIRCTIHGFKVDIAFFHANKRHHSLAFGDQQKKRLHHFMLEVRSMDDVGLAFDRALKSGVRIMQTLGKHPNDQMFSFYAKTPSGFQFELGWGGREVDDATWEPTTYDHISEWGHHPPEFLAPKPKGKP